MKWLLLCLALLPMASHAQDDTAVFGQGQTPFVIRSTTDISIIAPAIQRFSQTRPDLKIIYEEWGSNALFDRARSDCTGGGYGADVVWSSAVHQMVWLVNAACGQPHQSAATTALPKARKWRDELWGITQEPAVIVYNRSAFAGKPLPRNRFDLLDLLRDQPEQFRARIATYDIEASGLGFLFALSDSLEASTFGALMESFARVDAVATCCSAEIITGVAEGQYVLAYNVLGSYVATRPEVGVILPDDYTTVLSRALMIPQKAKEPEAAKAFLEFLLTQPAQSILQDAGLIMPLSEAESGLAISARRPIALSPTLLVGLDQARLQALLSFWDDTFQER